MTMHTIKHRAPISCMGSFVLAISFAKLSGLDSKAIFEFLLGYRALHSIVHRAGFLFVTILLQYYTAEPLVYLLHNSDNLCIRFNSIRRYCASVIRSAVVNTAVFFLSSVAGMTIALLVLKQILPKDILIVMVWGYVLCLAFVLCQIMLMMYFKESETFGILGIGAIAYSFLSCLKPSFSFPLWWVRWLFISVVLAAELICAINTLKKRWVVHEN